MDSQLACVPGLARHFKWIGDPINADAVTAATHQQPERIRRTMGRTVKAIWIDRPVFRALFQSEAPTISNAMVTQEPAYARQQETSPLCRVSRTESEVRLFTAGHASISRVLI
jgi:hypothetical protein